MDMIKDIYNRELYQPFVEYCATHGYHTMRDLGCYDFRLLSRREDFSPMLITRIKAVYAAYQKQEAEKAEAAALKKLAEAEAADMAKKKTEEAACHQSAIFVTPLNSAPPPPEFMAQTGEAGDEHPIMERDGGDVAMPDVIVPPPPPSG